MGSLFSHPRFMCGCVIAAATAFAAPAPAATIADSVADLLPAETNSGEWLNDTLDDARLWFASSNNLRAVAIAAELRDYSRGRRWLQASDAHPAWVMYYVPGRIEQVEIDTHHWAGGAIDFRFSAGPVPAQLTALDVQPLPVAVTAGWLRALHASDALPPNASFLLIEFPAGADFDRARLTEVWIRYTPRPAEAETQPAPNAASPAAISAAATDSISPAASPAVLPAASPAAAAVAASPLPSAPPVEPELPAAAREPTAAAPASGALAAAAPETTLSAPPAMARALDSTRVRSSPHLKPAKLHKPPKPSRASHSPLRHKRGPRSK